MWQLGPLPTRRWPAVSPPRMRRELFSGCRGVAARASRLAVSGTSRALLSPGRGIGSLPNRWIVM
jgi:hypothetical protein